MSWWTMWYASCYAECCITITMENNKLPRMAINNDNNSSSDIKNVVNKMRNVELIEVNIMYGGIKDLQTPKEVLEKLAVSKCAVFGLKDSQIRYLTYGLWLSKNGYDTWLKFLGNMNKFVESLTTGDIIRLSEPPEGWISPLAYLNGVIPGGIKNETKKSND